MIRVAMMQMEVVFGDVKQNLRTMERALGEVAAKADLCVFPECMDAGWANENAGALAQPIPGRVSDFYCRMAREHGVWLAAGLTEACGGRLYNAALLISDAGEIVLHHRKINILTGVEDMYEVGDRLAVADTPFGRVGLTICADNAVNSMVLGESLGRMGARLLLSPSAWAVEAETAALRLPYGDNWRSSYRRLSRTYGMAIVSVSNVGQVSNGVWAGWKAIGNSLAYDCSGGEAAALPYGEDAVEYRIVELELAGRPLTGTALAEAASATR